eukprot:s204_g7.t6
MLLRSCLTVCGLCAALALNAPVHNCWCGGFSAKTAVLGSDLWLLGGYGGGLSMADASSNSWNICGAGASTEFSARVWRYSGHTWEVLAPQGSTFSARRGLALTAGLSKLWVIAGRDSGALLADVWSSPDGLVWTLETAAASFGTREGHGAAELSGDLFVFGGHDGATLLADTWSSSSGSTWTQTSATPGWAPRRDFGAVAHLGKIFLAGGYGATGLLEDVWSGDGSSWIEELASAAWGPRAGPGLASFAEELWLFGGFRLLPTASYVPGPYQRHWSPEDQISQFLWLTESVARVSYASRRLALADISLSGGGGADVLVASTKRGGVADMRGVKVGDRLVSVLAFGLAEDFTAFEASPAGGLDALPAGEVVLGFIDPGSVGTIPRKWSLDSQMPYTVDVWRSADGVTWTQQSEEFWDGLAENLADSLGTNVGSRMSGCLCSCRGTRKPALRQDSADRAKRRHRTASLRHSSQGMNGGFKMHVCSGFLAFPM